MHVFLKWGPFINYVCTKGGRGIDHLGAAQGDGVGGEEMQMFATIESKLSFKDCDEMA